MASGGLGCLMRVHASSREVVALLFSIVGFDRLRQWSEPSDDLFAASDTMPGWLVIAIDAEQCWPLSDGRLLDSGRNDATRVDILSPGQVAA